MRSAAGAVQRYTPEPVTDEGTNRELQRIASAMSAIADGHLDLTTVAPTKPRSGDIRYGAAGVLGVGEGVYAYYAAAWHLLG